MIDLTPFDIAERDDPDGARRLTVTGELDLATAPKLRERLSELQAARRNVRLDLSQLEFIDSTGIGIIARALRDSERGSWMLDVDPNLPRQVARLLTIAGISDRLWGQQRFTPGTSEPRFAWGPVGRPGHQGTAPPLP